MTGGRNSEGADNRGRLWLASTFLLALAFGISLSGTSCTSSSSRGKATSTPVCVKTPAVTPTPGTAVSYSSQLVPIFQAACTSCHSGGSSASSCYDLSTYAGATGSGSEATSMGVCDVVKGDGPNSYLIRKLNGGPNISGNQMPSSGVTLSAAQIATIQAWIDQGAPNN